VQDASKPIASSDPEPGYLVRVSDVEQRRATILDTIVVNLTELLLIDLGAVTYLSSAAVSALLSGYIAAFDHGTRYNVVNAR
jgi:anti-anti-sigma regulatory factor